MSETQRSRCVIWLDDVHCNLVRSENDLHGVKSMAGDRRGKDDPLSQRYIGQLRKLMIINYEQATKCTVWTYASTRGKIVKLLANSGPYVLRLYYVCPLPVYDRETVTAVAAAVRAEIRAMRRPSVQPSRFVVQSAAVPRRRVWHHLLDARWPTVSYRRFYNSTHHTPNLTAARNDANRCRICEFPRFWVSRILGFYRATACNATHGIAKALLSVRLKKVCYKVSLCDCHRQSCKAFHSHWPI